MGQLIATVVALLLAVPGVIFALRTYRDQLTLNRIALDRNDRRYASRVTFWDVVTQAKDLTVRVRIRNMTPMPIKDVVLLSTTSIQGDRPRPATGIPYQPLVHRATIPPCSEVEIWVEPGDLQRAWRRMLGPATPTPKTAPAHTWVSTRMYFFVAGKYWTTTDMSLEPAGDSRVYDIWPRESFTKARMQDAYGEPAAIEDCGESA